MWDALLTAFEEGQAPVQPELPDDLRQGVSSAWLQGVVAHLRDEWDGPLGRQVRHAVRSVREAEDRAKQARQAAQQQGLQAEQVEVPWWRLLEVQPAML